MSRPFEFNDPPERRHKWVAGLVGLAGFAGVLGIVFWFLFEMAKGVAQR